MNNNGKSMDSVFDDSKKSELDFETMFDREDSLIDHICGVKENGDPLTGTDYPEVVDDDSELDDHNESDEKDKDLDHGKEPENEDNNSSGTEGDEKDKNLDHGKEPENEDNNSELVDESIDIDSILDPVGESADKDVKSVLDDELNDDSDDINKVNKNKEKAGKLNYEFSDEELIDIAMNS